MHLKARCGWQTKAGLRLAGHLILTMFPYEPESKLGVIYSRPGSDRQLCFSLPVCKFWSVTMYLTLLGSANQPVHALLIAMAKAQHDT